jgi:hypothetical protein
MKHGLIPVGTKLDTLGPIFIRHAHEATVSYMKGMKIDTLSQIFIKISQRRLQRSLTYPQAGK